MKSLMHRSAAVLAVLFAMLVAAAPAMAADPTIDQIYQAQRSGQPAQARQLMDEVLRNHPNSAKAHFVDAELLAESGDTTRAAQALSAAQRLAPGLPFASQGEVLRLQSRISMGSTGAADSARASSRAVAPAAAPSSAPSPGGLSMSTVLVGLIVLVLFVWVVRRFIRSAAAQRANTFGGPAGQTYPDAQYGAPPQYGPSYGPQPTGGGLGGRVAGGLATGLAVGAGVMAAEAIGHRMFGHDTSGATGDRLSDDGAGHSPVYEPANDFGIQDSSSWDDAGSSDSGGSDSGSSDWDN
ncbi:hypothetical protein BH09PSE6_BH09PSE6_00900 [soil metagenome]